MSLADVFLGIQCPTCGSHDRAERLLSDIDTGFPCPNEWHESERPSLSDFSLTVRKATAYVDVPVELALDYGLMTEAEARARGWSPPPTVRIPWCRRARWRWQAARERWGRRIGGWIAGIDLSESDEP